MKKKLNQLKSLFNFKDQKKAKQYKIIASVMVLVVILYLASSTNSAYPGSPLYSLDRNLEKLASKFTKNPKKIIDQQLSYATERLVELKDTTRNTEDTAMLVNDFKNNLDLVSATFKEMTRNDEYSDEELAEIVKDLVDVRSASFERTIIVRKEGASVKSVQKEISKASKYVNAFIEDIFNSGINEISEGTDFDVFAENMVTLKVRDVAQSVKYMEEDSAVLTPQLTDEQISELNDLVNSIREEFFKVRDDVGSRPNKDVYLDLVKSQNRIDEEFSPKIVELSQANIKKIK